jgi:hypothetical protein
MRSLCHALIALLSTAALSAQSLSPEITSWVLNTTGSTGYAGIQSNVQKVQYSTGWVYVSCTCIPGYDIGPWAGNPNIPANQNFIYRITRSPQPNGGTPTATPRGHIGVWSNGVSIFNAMDARSYNNQNVWNQNAIVVEGSSFDSCLGHPAPNGEYHHHLNPRCLYDDRDSSRHSPIIGYAFDGYPIYGAYGSRNADGSGGITRMRSSYRLRSITERTTLPDGSSALAGPPVSTQYPLGYYIEDFEYVPGLGDLDEHNGRLCVTPEYPNGTYAYFVTLDANGVAAYPYTLGTTYYGVVPAGNTGPQSGHNTPSEPVTTYAISSDVDDEATSLQQLVYPNPATATVTVIAPADGQAWHVALCDLLGRELMVAGDMKETIFSVAGIPDGAYVVKLNSAQRSRIVKLTVVH